LNKFKTHIPPRLNGARHLANPFLLRGYQRTGQMAYNA